MRPNDSAANTMNSATSSAADPVTTNTFPQPAVAAASFVTPELRLASCKSHDQKNLSAPLQIGARFDIIPYTAFLSTGGPYCRGWQSEQHV
jgi:hypothetical protein